MGRLGSGGWRLGTRPRLIVGMERIWNSLMCLLERVSGCRREGGYWKNLPRSLCLGFGRGVKLFSSLLNGIS